MFLILQFYIENYFGSVAVFTEICSITNGQDINFIMIIYILCSLIKYCDRINCLELDAVLSNITNTVTKVIFICLNCVISEQPRSDTYFFTS